MAPLVEILVGVAGADFGWHPGELVEMSDEDAAKWADGERGRLAARSRPDGPIETTEQPPAAEPQREPRREKATEQPAPDTPAGRPAPRTAAARRPSSA